MFTALELDHLSLPLLVATDLEVLATLDGDLLAGLAVAALHTKHNLFGRLRLLTQNGLRLATETLLLAIVTTTALGGARLLALLVLRHLVQRVLLALALAEGASSLRYVNHGHNRGKLPGRKTKKQKTNETRHTKRETVRKKARHNTQAREEQEHRVA